MQTIKVQSLFDITNTGIVRNYNKILLANHDSIKTESEWRKARHQQQNFETLLQVISLRGQPTVIKGPYKSKYHLKKFNILEKGNIWTFVFTVESDGIYDDFTNPIGLLESDIENVPMITKLEESISDEYLILNKNIRFELLSNEE